MRVCDTSRHSAFGILFCTSYIYYMQLLLILRNILNLLMCYMCYGYMVMAMARASQYVFTSNASVYLATITTVYCRCLVGFILPFRYLSNLVVI
jgi:hypothetical protein